MKKFISLQAGWLILISLALCTVLAGCQPNDSPVISNLVCQKSWVNISTSCQIECDASDVNGDSLTYTWSAAAGSFSGSGPVVTWTAPDQAGTFEILVDVADQHGDDSTSQLSIEVKENHKPAIETITAEPLELRAGDESVLKCVASDPDGDELSYSWLSNGGKIIPQGDLATWTAPEKEGTYSVRVKAADGRGGESTVEETIKVIADEPPVIDSLDALTQEVNPNVPVKIECKAWDPEGDSLSYAWTATGGTINGQGQYISWRSPEEYGTYTISVIVSDGKGGQTGEKVSIVVKNCG